MKFVCNCRKITLVLDRKINETKCPYCGRKYTSEIRKAKGASPRQVVELVV